MLCGISHTWQCERAGTVLEAYARSYIAYMHDAELAALNVDDVATRTNADERYLVSRQLQQMQQKRHGQLVS